MSQRIKQFPVVECMSYPGKRPVPTGNRAAFFAFTGKECQELLTDWLGTLEKGWKAAKTRHTVRRGQVVWQVLDGCTVP